MKYPDRTKNYNLKFAYGISSSTVKEITAKQENVCAICGRIASLCVDHCHSNGKVRGMLCAKCNQGLGLFYDNPILLEKAVEYLTIWDDKAVRVVPEMGTISNQTDVIDPLVRHNTDPIGSFFE